jgi:hypothetical protein
MEVSLSITSQSNSGWCPCCQNRRLLKFSIITVHCRKGPFTRAIFAAILVAIFSFWRIWRSIDYLMTLLRNFITWNIHNLSTPSHPSEEENRPKIAAKIARVNGPIDVWQDSFIISYRTFFTRLKYRWKAVEMSRETPCSKQPRSQGLSWLCSKLLYTYVVNSTYRFRFVMLFVVLCIY